MKLSHFCINRPIFSMVLSLFLVLVGIISYAKLSIREYPNIDPPVVTVSTTYRGASAKVIESQITKRLEDALSSIQGIDYISSISREENSQITIYFKLDRNPNEASAEVRDRINRISATLPTTSDDPIIERIEADAQPIIYLAFSSDRHNPMAVTEFAETFAKDALQTLNGVAEVKIFGARHYAMHIGLDPEKLSAYQINPEEVEIALQSQNIDIAAGRIESLQREFTISTETDLKTISEFENIIVKKTDDQLVKLKEIASVEIQPENERIAVRFKGEQAIALGIVKLATANPLSVSEQVNQALPRIEKALPEGMKITLGHDKSVFIKESIKNVYKTLFEACFLVLFIIAIFLKSFRAILIPFMVIPISLMGAFIIMFAFDFSINTLTLLAMVLAIGLVVDDAIVMLENCYRHIELGQCPLKAAHTGASEIGFAIIAMTLTLAIVYFPVGFLTGATGKLFTEFAWVLAGSVLISGFVALTLSPMMCAYLLKQEVSRFKFFSKINFYWEKITLEYQNTLKLFFQKKKIIFWLVCIILVLNVVLIKILKSELAPTEDQNTIVCFFMAPEGSSLAYTDTYAKQLEAHYRAIKEVDRYFSITGFPVVSQGIAFVKLVMWQKRDRKQQDITQALRMKLFQNPGLMAFATDLPALGQSFQNKPLSIVLQSNDSYEKLDSIVKKIFKKLEAYPYFFNLDSDLKLNKPQITVSMDREKIALVGLSIEKIARAIELFFGGKQITRFKKNNEQYDVIIQGKALSRNTPTDLNKIYLKNKEDQMIPLSSVIQFKQTVGPKSLNHFNKFRSATLSANFPPFISLGQALKQVEQVIHEVAQKSVQIDYTGQSREYKSTTTKLTVLFFLALIFIYLILSAQFESFLDPFIILLSVPLSTFGAIFCLFLFKGSLNIYSQVGLITLIGIISKHGILIVEFANQLMRLGTPILEAIQKAAFIRFRPILMTTLATSFGVFPLVFATGAGASGRNQIGLVIVGGMLIGTFFTLFVVPVFYLAIKSPNIAMRLFQKIR